MDVHNSFLATAETDKVFNGSVRINVKASSIRIPGLGISNQIPSEDGGTPKLMINFISE
jgi:hypothetical protein